MKPHPDPHGSSHYDRKTGVLTIVRILESGKEVKTSYHFQWNTLADFGKPCCRLLKLDKDGMVSDTHDLRNRNGKWECDCRDAVSRDRSCKHARSVAEQIKSGRLKVPKSMAR